jgi:hypothetical protein
LEKEIIDSFAAQVRLPATVVLMRDIIQKASDTDKSITLALRRSVWLSYLLSIGAISAGGLSIFSVSAILGTKPAQANMKEQAVSLPAQTVEEESAIQTSSRSSEHTYPTGFHQDLANREPSPTAEGDFQTKADITGSRHTADSSKIKISEASEALTLKADAPYVTTTALSELQDLGIKDKVEPQVSRIASFSPNRDLVTSSLSIPTQPLQDSAGLLSVKAKPAPTVEIFSKNVENSLDSVEPLQASSPPLKGRALNSVEGNVPEQLALGDDPTTVGVATAPSQTEAAPAINSVEGDVPAQLALGDDPTTVEAATAPSPTEAAPTVYKGTGGASLLGDNIQAQSSIEDKQEPASLTQNTPQEIDPLAPTLNLQGVYLYQGDSSARARLTGIYPISPNALFGGSLDLTAGDGFSDSPGGGLQLNELYFTGSLPRLPSLRLTAGLVDLTSYFDRNSFAKDATTHFFNPVFQTNPALSSAGISSRPGVLLNWDITDNFQARAAAFSSHRNLGDFALDGFASEVAFRSGNAIIRGTFASNRDAGRNNGFKEIYEIDRGDGDFGIESDDRENAYGINAEYFIPQIKMGLFGRYGRYENTSLGKGGDTYSLGLNFLDLFMRDDRLGFGYGRDLSNNELRRDRGNKVPDVWELFYDFRVSPNFRAGVTLQARDEFSDVVAGFRVKTEFDLTSLGRLLR